MKIPDDAGDEEWVGEADAAVSARHQQVDAPHPQAKLHIIHNVLYMNTPVRKILLRTVKKEKKKKKILIKHICLRKVVQALVTLY